MSWHDPKGPWQRKLRWRIRLFSLAGLISFGPVILFLPTMLRVRGTLPTGNLGYTIALMPAIMGIAALAGALMMFMFIRTQRTILREVPKRDGHLCPRCRTVLPENTEAGDCPKCCTPYTHAELESYWVDYVLEPQRIRPWAKKGSWRQRVFGLFDRHRKSTRGQIALSCVIFIVALIVIRIVVGGSLTGTAVRLLPMFVGGSLLGSGIARTMKYRSRSGESRHCTDCGYQQAPEGENPKHCPECGADWTKPGSVVIGEVGRDPRQLLLAGASVCVGFLLMYSYVWQIQGGGWLTRVLPTPVLIRDIADSDVSIGADWNEIQRRQLTPAQELQLAGGLLDRRLRRDYLDSTAGGWLWTRVSTGVLPDDLIERYYREMLEVWIDAPATARVGEPFQVSIGSNYRSSNPPTGIYTPVYFGGFFLGADATALERREGPTPSILLDNPEYQINANITPSLAGPRLIQAVLYFAVGPNLLCNSPGVEWHDDGTATIPATAVWSHRIEVEKVIEVSE